MFFTKGFLKARLVFSCEKFGGLGAASLEVKSGSRVLHGEAGKNAAEGVKRHLTFAVKKRLLTFAFKKKRPSRVLPQALRGD